MKKIFILKAILISFLSFGQVPQGISYQAISLNSSGNPVVSSNVGIRLSVLDNSASGTVLYTESHTKMTNAQGLFNLVIGQGTPTTGTFSAINWGTNSKFLKVEMDTAGGTNYVLVGTTQLLSVPYAMVAGSVSNVSNSGTISFKNNTGDGTFVVYSNSEAKAYNVSSGWGTTQTFSGTIKGTTSNNNAIIIFSDNEAKSYNTSTGWGTTQTINGSNINAISCNTASVVYTDSEAKAYINTSGWGTTQTISGIKGAISANSCIVVFSNTEAKAYNVSSSGWGTTQTLNGIKGGYASGNNIVIYSDTETKVYNGTNGWGTTQTLNGVIKNATGTN